MQQAAAQSKPAWLSSISNPTCSSQYPAVERLNRINRHRKVQSCRSDNCQGQREYFKLINEGRPQSPPEAD